MASIPPTPPTPAGHPSTGGSQVQARQARQVRRSGPETVSIPLPWMGTVRISRPELAYVGGIVALSIVGLLEWPMALVIASGHIIAADRSSQTVRELGDAMTEA